MKDRKGQALVEFVLLIPIIVVLIFGMIELGNMIHKKYMLETYIDTAIDLYKQDKKEVIEYFEEENSIDISFEEVGSLVKAKVSMKVNVITPGINTFIGNPYIITSTRSFYKSNMGVTTNE